MVEVINNSGTQQPTREVVERDSGAGWAVAVIILVAIILIGGYYVLHHRTYIAAPATTPAATVNVSVPTGSSGSTGNTGSGATQ